MTELTLEAVQAKQAELAEMIEKLQQRATLVRSITLDEIEIDLQPGEHYAGAILNEEGNVDHHVVLMAPKPSERLCWDDARAWANGVGGDLPSRREQALLYANSKSEFEAAYYWSNQAHESDASYAWYCYFDYGTQGSTLKSFEGRARAVRRI